MFDEYVNGALNPRGSHYALVTAKNDTGWDLADPGWLFASPQSALGSLDGHYMGFTTFSSQNTSTAIFHQFTVREARAYTLTSLANPNPTPVPNSLTVTAFSPVELLLTDPEGRRLGYSQQTGEVAEIPTGNYYRDFPIAPSDNVDAPSLGDPTGIKTAYIVSPQSGTFRLDTFGTALGSYSLVIRTSASSGSPQEASFVGLANVGQASTYEIGYSATSPTPITGQRVVTFQNALADISNSVQLGLIDNPGTANALASKIEAAQSAAARGENQTAVNILQAFQNQVNAQTGKHISGIAPQVLNEDASSIVSQLQ